MTNCQGHGAQVHLLLSTLYQFSSVTMDQVLWSKAHEGQLQSAAEVVGLEVVTAWHHQHNNGLTLGESGLCHPLNSSYPWLFTM